MIENFWMGIVANECDQSSHGTLKLTVSEKWADGIKLFLHVGTDSRKGQADQNFCWVGMVKNGCGQSGDRTLKLTWSQKWADRITDFFHAGTGLGNLKIDCMSLRFSDVFRR